MKQLPILYKYTQTGKIQQWQIVVEGDKFYTIEGIMGGKLTQSLPTVCEGKNIGKKNETKPKEQAVAQALAKHNKKIAESYNQVLTATTNYFEPMLATEDKKVKLNWNKRIFVQPKLDGLRCISEKNTLMSRNGKPYVACPHLYQNSTLLDGELYSHTYHDDFNKIVSLCKKQSPTREELEESKKMVQFWAYDFPGYIGVFSERYERLEQWVLMQAISYENRGEECPYIVVPTYEVFNQKDIDKMHDLFLSQGYEGTIIRIDEGRYENKRSKQLLKHKDFVDEEFKIIGYEEGEGGRTGTIGKFVIQLPDNKTCETNVKGNFDFLKEVWRDRDIYMGTLATVKYFGWTPAGKLRFPYVIKLNRHAYE